MASPHAAGSALPAPLTPDQVVFYTELRDAHGDDVVLGACVICSTHRCREYRYAVAQLILSGLPIPQVV